MPRSRAVEHYPNSFRDLVREGCTKEIPIPLDSPQEAKSLRGRLYSFLGSLSAAVKQPDCPQEYKELRQMAYKIQIIIDPKLSSVLLVRPLDYDPAGTIVAQAVARAAPGKVLDSQKLVPSQDLLNSIQQEAKNRK